MKHFKRFLRWWYRGHRLQVLMWELYDSLAVKDVPPPPFKRPTIPQWVKRLTAY